MSETNWRETHIAISERVAAIRRWIPPCPAGLDIRQCEYGDARGRRRISLSLWAAYNDEYHKIAQWDCRLSRYESRMQQFADRGMTILDVFTETIKHRSVYLVLGKINAMGNVLTAMERATGEHYQTTRDASRARLHTYEIYRLKRKIKKLKKRIPPCE